MIANGRKSASDAATPAADAPYNDGAYMGDTPEDSRSKVTDATPRARAAAAVAAAGAGGAGGGAGAGAATLADMLDGGADMHVPDMHHIGTQHGTRCAILAHHAVCLIGGWFMCLWLWVQ